jgi:hypothetical protein
MRNRRIDDLRKTLRTGRDVHNKNHTTVIRNGVRAFDGAHPGCINCELNLVCLSGRPVDHFQAHYDKRSCAVQNTVIQFQYYTTVCLSYDITQQHITDHWQYGRSVSTSRAIRWYIEALKENDVIPYGFDENELIKTFRDRPQVQGEGWLSCP